MEKKTRIMKEKTDGEVEKELMHKFKAKPIPVELNP
jgi:hypothetical protein